MDEEYSHNPFQQGNKRNISYPHPKWISEVRNVWGWAIVSAREVKIGRLEESGESFRGPLIIKLKTAWTFGHKRSIWAWVFENKSGYSTILYYYLSHDSIFYTHSAILRTDLFSFVSFISVSLPTCNHNSGMTFSQLKILNLKIISKMLTSLE